MAYLLPEGTPVFYNNEFSHVTINNDDYLPPHWTPLKLVPAGIFGPQPKVIVDRNLFNRLVKFFNNLFFSRA
jgi:hypothetical protein